MNSARGSLPLLGSLPQTTTERPSGVPNVVDWLESLPDWLASLNDLTAIPLQAVGFSIAIWQILKAKGESKDAKDAARAATAAIASTRRSMLLSQLESSLPQLAAREDELEDALRSGNVEDVRRGLRKWRAESLRVAAALSGVAPLGAAAAKTLRHAASKAGQARHELLTEVSSDDLSEQAAKVTRDVLAAISDATYQLPDLEQEVSASRFSSGETQLEVETLDRPKPNAVRPEVSTTGG